MPDADRAYLVERVGDVGLVQLYADHFAELTLEERILAYHLYRASIAGDRIAHDQRYAHNLAIKDLLETLLTAGTATPAMVEYTKLFWLHHGVHDMLTSRKHVPSGFSFADLIRAAHAALDAGATGLGADGAALDAELESLRRPIFDPDFEPSCTNKSPPAGQDIISASFNTFYPGLTARDLRRFRDQYPLNSRVVRNGRRLEEVVYRTGDDHTDPGLYAEDLRGVVVHLTDAIAVAPPAQQEYYRHLVRFFQTGDNQAFRDYNILWVQDDPRVDAILGFIETYTDARSAKGLWEGVTFYRNEGRTELMRQIAREARYFEERVPWDPAYRRTEFPQLVATTVDALVETGDGGPFSAAGINLPNEEAIRERHGSRNFFLDNVIESGDLAAGEIANREFAGSEAEAAEAERCGRAVWNTMVVLHEVTGHASGRVSDELEGDPSEHLREYASTLEEARADLVGLWHMADPRIRELRMLPDEGCIAAGYRLFAASFVSSLRRYGAQDTIEEDHDRARALILGFAEDRGAVHVERRDGHFYLDVPDGHAFRETVGALLTELQRIKSTGDRAAIAALVERFGTRIDPAMRDDAIARARRVGMPLSYAFVSLRLVADRAADGSITDVRVERPESFQSLMLEWSTLARESRERGRTLAP